MANPARRSSGDGLASIGVILERLREDFPDVSMSKIRFLESEGLVTPERSPSGFRRFSGADEERLRFVLAAQRDHYMPLKKIREQLEAIDRGEIPAEGPTPMGVLGLVPAPAPPTGPPAARLTRDDLLVRTGLEKTQLAEMIRVGLISTGPAGYFAPEAVTVGSTVRALLDHGLEIRHLRALRTAADREAGLVLQLATPIAKRRDVDARARADEVVREVTGLTGALHAALVLGAIAEALDGGLSRPSR